MNERERPHSEIPLPGATGLEGAPGAANLNAVRSAGAAMLAAADNAIARVLSGDSLQFNEAARQQGGE